MKCKKYTLEELVSIKYGKSQKKVVSENGTIPIYGTGGQMGYATEFIYDKPSVLIGRKGTISKVRYVEHPFWTVDTSFYTIVNTDIVIPKYLYYVMSQIDLNRYNEGTTIPSLRKETLNRLEFYIPSLEEQKRILEFLEPIDNKIKINDIINNNLEQQVSSIYKSWFEDFDLSNGTCPSNWVKGTFSTIIDISSGKRPPVKNELYSKETPFPIIGASSIMGYTSNSNNQDKILVIGRVGTHGIVQKLNRPCWPSDNTLIIKSPYYEFVNQILRKIDYSSLNRGSTQPLITQSDIKKIEILIPDQETIFKFEKIATTLMNLFEENSKENEKLSLLKDEILPKLISGEIDISSIKI